mgnify:FL=1
MLITQNSTLTGKLNTMELDITYSNYTKYKLGKENVQDVFPHLNVYETEFLISGVTPQEWDSMLLDPIHVEETVLD